MFGRQTMVRLELLCLVLTPLVQLDAVLMRGPISTKGMTLFKAIKCPLNGVTACATGTQSADVYHGVSIYQCTGACNADTRCKWFNYADYSECYPGTCTKEQTCQLFRKKPRSISFVPGCKLMKVSTFSCWGLPDRRTDRQPSEYVNTVHSGSVNTPLSFLTNWSSNTCSSVNSELITWM